MPASQVMDLSTESQERDSSIATSSTLAEADVENYIQLDLQAQSTGSGCTEPYKIDSLEDLQSSFTNACQPGIFDAVGIKASIQLEKQAQQLQLQQTHKIRSLITDVDGLTDVSEAASPSACSPQITYNPQSQASPGVESDNANSSRCDSLDSDVGDEIQSKKAAASTAYSNAGREAESQTGNKRGAGYRRQNKDISESVQTLYSMDGGTRTVIADIPCVTDKNTVKNVESLLLESTLLHAAAALYAQSFPTQYEITGVGSCKPRSLMGKYIRVDDKYYKFSIQNGYEFKTTITFDEIERCWWLQSIQPKVTFRYRAIAELQNKDELPHGLWKGNSIDVILRPYIGISKKSVVDCESCKQSNKYTTIYFGSNDSIKKSINPERGAGQGLGVPMLKIFPPCQNQCTGWRISKSRDIADQLPPAPCQPVALPTTVIPKSSKRQHEDDDDLDIDRLFKKHLDYGHFDLVKQMLKVELDIDDVQSEFGFCTRLPSMVDNIHPRFEGSIITKFDVKVNPNGWLPKSSIQNWIVKGAKKGLTAESHFKILHIAAEFTSDSTINFLVKFDANYRDEDAQKHIDSLDLPGKIPGYIEYAVKEFEQKRKLIGKKIKKIEARYGKELLKSRANAWVKREARIRRQCAIKLMIKGENDGVSNPPEFNKEVPDTKPLPADHTQIATSMEILASKYGTLQVRKDMKQQGLDDGIGDSIISGMGNPTEFDERDSDATELRQSETHSTIKFEPDSGYPDSNISAYHSALGMSVEASEP